MPRKLLGACAASSSELLETHAAPIQLVCDDFDAVIKMLGGIYIGNFDKKCKSALVVATTALSEGGENPGCEAIVKLLEAF